MCSLVKTCIILIFFFSIKFIQYKKSLLDSFWQNNKQTMDKHFLFNGNNPYKELNKNCKQKFVKIIIRMHTCTEQNS